MRKIFLALMIGAFLQSCSQRVGNALIANTKWKLTDWPGRTIPVNGQATLNFGEVGKIGGKSFCNSYGGSSEINNGTVKFSQIFSTKMFCTDFSDAENNYQADLQTVNNIKMSAGKLQLFKDDKLIMTFGKTE